MTTLAPFTAPLVASYPEGVSSAGSEAIDLARMAGLVLDPWQELVLDRSLVERKDGKLSAFEVGLLVPRQNGKGGILEARQLTELFLLLAGRTVIHSAHEFATSLEAFRRLLWIIEGTPELDRRIKRVSKSHGDEGIELIGGSRIRFRTRTKGGGRGFSCDLLILDEAMFLPEPMVGALMPTLSARPNPQVWYVGSAVDKVIHTDGMVLARVRERGRRGDDPRLAFFEWSVDRRDPGDDEPYTPDRVTADVARDPDAWAEANPALGIRITQEHVAAEQRAMDHRTFCVERLGVGDWPDTTGDAASVIDAEAWLALTDRSSVVLDPVTIAFDVTPDRAWASIAVAGVREDGLGHVEVVDRRRGTGWVAARVAEIAIRHNVQIVVCDAAGPAASLIGDVHELVREMGVEVAAVSAQDHARACGQLFDAVDQRTIRHLGTSDLDDAVRGAVTRALGDAWAWARKSSQVDISPLVAVTLARFAPNLIEAPATLSWRPL